MQSNLLPSLAGLSLTGLSQKSCRPCATIDKIVEYNGEDALRNQGGHHFAEYPPDNDENGTRAPGCPICLDLFDEGRDGRDGEDVIVLACGHAFHLRCMTTVARIARQSEHAVLCPECRTSLKQAEQVEVQYIESPAPPAPPDANQGGPAQLVLGIWQAFSDGSSGNSNAVLSGMTLDELKDTYGTLVTADLATLMDNNVQQYLMPVKRAVVEYITYMIKAHAHMEMETMMDSFEVNDAVAFGVGWQSTTRYLNDDRGYPSLIEDVGRWSFVEGLDEQRGRGSITYRPLRFNGGRYQGMSYIEAMIAMCFSWPRSASVGNESILQAVFAAAAYVNSVYNEPFPLTWPFVRDLRHAVPSLNLTPEWTAKYIARLFLGDNPVDISAGMQFWSPDAIIEPTLPERLQQDAEAEPADRLMPVLLDVLNQLNIPLHTFLKVEKDLRLKRLLS